MRVGFEPTEPVKAQRFSRPPDSTTLAPHHTSKLPDFLRHLQRRHYTDFFFKMSLSRFCHYSPREVLNPSEVFLAERRTGASGSTVVASIEGTRPLLLEVQALVAPTSSQLHRNGSPHLSNWPGEGGP